jgi:hypothetical protein
LWYVNSKKWGFDHLKRKLALTSTTGLFMFRFVNYQNFIRPLSDQHSGTLNSTRSLTEDDIKNNQSLFVDAIQNKQCDDVGIDAQGNLVTNFQPQASETPRCLDLFQKNANFSKMISFNALPPSGIKLVIHKDGEINIKFDNEVNIFFNTQFEPINSLNLNKVGQLRKAQNSFYSLEASTSALPVHVDNTLSPNFNFSYLNADHPIVEVEDYAQISYEDTSSVAYRKLADKVLKPASLKIIKTALANGTIVRTSIEVFDNFKAFPIGQMVPAIPH